MELDHASVRSRVVVVNLALVQGLETDEAFAGFHFFDALDETDSGHGCALHGREDM